MLTHTNIRFNHSEKHFIWSNLCLCSSVNRFWVGIYCCDWFSGQHWEYEPPFSLSRSLPLSLAPSPYLSPSPSHFFSSSLHLSRKLNRTSSICDMQNGKDGHKIQFISATKINHRTIFQHYCLSIRLHSLPLFFSLSLSLNFMFPLYSCYTYLLDWLLHCFISS